MANSTTRFSQLMGAPCTRQSVIQSLQSDPATYQLYQQMIPVYQEKILNFLTGQRGLEILYDGIFQQILNPYYEAVQPGESQTWQKIILQRSHPCICHYSYGRKSF